jgi:DNA-binding transcriptional LysR family regulator
MDRLTSLTAFVRVAETGGFSAAARRLNMSVTMVSNHVKALEERLGARLLNRTTRRVSLTETGRSYLERATQILAELEEADQMASALHATPKGTLRMHTSTHVLRFIAPVMADFLRRHPEVAIDLSVGPRNVDLIEEGYDLAIRTTESLESSLIARRLTPWRHYVACSPGYLETHKAPERPEDLAQHNCLR